MTTLAYRFALGAGCLVALTASSRPARACGGCFHAPPRPQETVVVTDHRMAFSVSTQQSVLWDQIRYSGNPSDFSWVLPVRSGTVVQASSDAWFSALDAMTTPTISGPSRDCTGGSGVGCAFAGASSSTASFGAAGSERGGVQVISQMVVGPYDAATLRATDPNALENWLASNGYVLPASMQPTVAAYVAGGFDFIALRMRPGLGVQAMQPVRVVTQGADVTLPLRMVAAGVGAQVGVTLYVIGEGRYEAAPPFDNAVVDDSKLVWFHAQNLSNYEELAQSLMKQNGGRTWLTEYSRAGDLATSGTQICGLSGTPYYSGQSLADLYLGQCPCNAGAASPLVFSQGDASDDALSALAVQPEASAGSPAFEASVPPSAPACTGDDVQVALVGLSTANVWVTRLRAVIPVNALSEHDLLLQAASVQTPVSNQHVTNTYDDPSYSPCGSQGSCAASDARGSSGWLEGGALCLAAAAGLRRLKRRVSGTSSQK